MIGHWVFWFCSLWVLIRLSFVHFWVGKAAVFLSPFKLMWYFPHQLNQHSGTCLWTFCQWTLDQWNVLCHLAHIWSLFFHLLRGDVLLPYPPLPPPATLRLTEVNVCCCDAGSSEHRAHWRTAHTLFSAPQHSIPSHVWGLVHLYKFR